MVFDKTGTLTQGVFEVNGIHHHEMENEKLVEYAALAESASSHPISKSLQRAYGREIDRSRVTDVQEISGSGVIAKVDGVEVAAGNDKLMDRLGVPYIPCHSVGTIIHMAVGGKYAGHIVISDVVKPHAREAVQALRSAGVHRTVMLTGDAKPVADQVAQSLGIDQVYAELLPPERWKRWKNCCWTTLSGKAGLRGGRHQRRPGPQPGGYRIAMAPWAPMPPSRPPTWS